MTTINIKTKFDIGDSVFGFVNEEIHNLIIDRIEIKTCKFSKDNPIQTSEIIYFATTTDAVTNYQHRFHNETLFTEDELKEYINKYFENFKG